MLFNAIASIAFANALLQDVELSVEPVRVFLALGPSALTIALAPATFLMYNWATAVEMFKDQDALRKVLRSQREFEFRARLKTLSRVGSRTGPSGFFFFFLWIS